MTQDEIIRMAREACASNQTFNSDEEWVKRFAALVAVHERNRLAWTQEHWTQYEHAIAAAEREACAKVCDEGAGAYVNSDYTKGLVHGARLCAAAIRARSTLRGDKNV